VMSDGAGPGSSVARIDILGPPGSGRLGHRRAHHRLDPLDSSLVLQNYQDWKQTLVDTLDPQRWYAVRVVYRRGPTRIRSTHPALRRDAERLRVADRRAGGDRLRCPGTASVDLIQVKPFVSRRSSESWSRALRADVQLHRSNGTRPSRAATRSPTRLASAATLTASRTAANEPRRKELTLEFEPNVGQPIPPCDSWRADALRPVRHVAETVPRCRRGRTRPPPLRRRPQRRRGTRPRRAPRSRTNLVGRDPPAGTATCAHAKGRDDQLYPGVNAVFYGNEGASSTTSSYRREPTRRLKLRFDGVDSLRSIRTATSCSRRPERAPAPQARRVPAGGTERRFVDASYTLLDRTSVGFRLGSFDDTLALTIDPTLVYSSFLAGPRTTRPRP
jgi:hypothetical protein